MKLKPYPKYKPSGVEWLGEVPEHWEVKRLKNAFKIFNGSTPESSNEEYWDGDIIWYTPEDLGDNAEKIINDSRRKITLKGYKNIGATIVPPESIIISTRAPIGHLSVTKVPACTNQGCRSLVPKDGVLSDYYYYYLSISKAHLNAIGKGTTFIELGNQGLGTYSIPFLPFDEQQLIASFLDRETGKIDELILKKEKLIELLKEKRTALISRAVTKGLNPDVRLKPSGVEWLGDVPEGWEVKRVKFSAKTVMGQSPNSDEYTDDNESLPFLQGNADFNERYPTPRIFCDTSNKVINKGALLISVRAPVGAINEADQKYGIGRGLCAINPDKVLSKDYLWYALHIVREELNTLATGSTYDAVSADQVGNMRITLPPFSEQQSIASFLDRETGKIDALMEKVRLAIEKLKEYRTALISAAVTGKIDVRGVA